MSSRVTVSLQPLEATGRFVRYCASCHASEEQKELMVCGRCQMKWYCSRKCQKAHWRTGHKAYCAQARHSPPFADCISKCIGPPSIAALDAICGAKIFESCCRVCFVSVTRTRLLLMHPPQLFIYQQGQVPWRAADHRLFSLTSIFPLA